MAETAKIVITAEDNASAVFEKFGRSVDKARDRANEVSDAFKKVGLGLTAVGTAGAFSIKALAESAGQFEQTKIAFGTLLGSAEAAETKLKELSQFAQKTPFTLPGIETAAKQLLAYGVTQDQLLPELKKLGDIAAGVGLDKFPQLTLAYGQVRAATKLTGAELRQFTEAGVPLLDELAKQFGVTAGEIQEMASGGAISFTAVSTALQNLTSNGGRFADLMEKQSGSLLGQFSNLEDSLGLLARELGAPLIEPLKELSGTVIKIAQSIGAFVKENPKIAEFAAKIILVGTAFALLAAPILLIVGFIPMIVGGFTAIATVVTTLVGLLLSPWTLIVAGIALLVAGIVWLVQNWEMVQMKIVEVWDMVTSYLSGVWSTITSATQSAWNAIRDFFVSIWATITSVFTTATQAISNAVTIAWNGIKSFFQTIWNGIVVVFQFALAFIVGIVISIFEKMGVDIVAVFKKIWDSLVAFWEDTKTFFTASLQFISDIWTTVWGTVSQFTMEILGTIKGWITGFWDDITALWNTATSAISSVWSTTWGFISENASSATNTVTSKVSAWWGSLRGMFEKYSPILQQAWSFMWEGIKNITATVGESVKGMFKGVVNYVIEKLNKLIQAINNVVQKGGSAVGLDVPNIPEIPMLAKGGIVTRPTLAMIGENGAEAVVPLSKGNMPGGSGVTINITGTFMSEDAAEKVADMVVRQLKLYSAVV